jgi:uncharacterized protein (DUF983 family)
VSLSVDPSVDRSADAPSIATVLLRGLAMRCPRCGGSSLYEGLLRLRARCEACRLDYAALGHDTWALIYLSTAGLTGVVVVGMLMIQPLDRLMGRFVLIAVAATLIPATLPLRKGVALAINYLIELKLSASPSGTDRTT